MNRAEVSFAYQACRWKITFQAEGDEKPIKHWLKLLSQYIQILEFEFDPIDKFSLREMDHLLYCLRDGKTFISGRDPLFTHCGDPDYISNTEQCIHILGYGVSLIIKHCEFLQEHDLAPSYLLEFVKNNPLPLKLDNQK